MSASNPLERTVEHPAGCDGYGIVNYIQTEDGVEREVAGRCPGCTQEKILNAIAKFVPPRFRKPIEISPAINDWLEKTTKPRTGEEDEEVTAEGLYLPGQTGSGKTHTAYETVTRWCLSTFTAPYNARITEEYGDRHRYGPSVVFVRATTLFDLLRPSAEDSRQTVLDCQQAKLLVIDDLGAEKPSEWTAERLYEVIDERYVHGKPLIVTSNVPTGKIADHVGARVASRFAEMCTVVPITGNDRRINSRAA
jgi:DNA replication protein DnaC